RKNCRCEACKDTRRECRPQKCASPHKCYLKTKDLLDSLQDKWNLMRPQPEDYENDHETEDLNDPEWVEFNPKVTETRGLTETFRIFTKPSASPDPSKKAPNTNTAQIKTRK
ncbi:hypothetical protein B0H16DRAFT_1330112, partial [Mycena metata]